MGSIKDNNFMNTIVPDTTIPPIDSDYPNYKSEMH
jgi:hypothetical protein